ncbi:DEAD/DEAH box helicase [Nitrobacter sp. Nb-311A]|uniref:DEAD/DEAH box helicase n=1 Tax=unclassified Nitrobacter TaxID=2620411 RepID=UPI0000686435|nr:MULTISPECIES: DEAD/DEAH box helicase [unclassified Nitrobacter]EAQ37265.1 DEAD/DEAH box helicase [Nitrobacter sp. Nb-311A]MCB1391676.1 DEAD/DEAH box helicase [Nitrobacter sp.]MCV0384967.1 DEAD/DEAH box helicase [Nitrobacter sp.]
MERNNLLSSFQDFGLADPISRALAEENYLTPTPIQAQTIPIALTGRDIVGIAQTGTGKTASFALPILHRLLQNRIKPQPKSCRVLVLSPTRELSGQILDNFNAYGRHLRLTSALAIGGVPMGRQVRSVMHGVDVMVATPGRLLDLVQSNGLKLGQVEFLVLDEADRMLDMGFIHDIRKVIAKLPVKRQTLLFSATMPKDIAELANQMLRDPARVAVTPVASTVDRIAQRIIQVDHASKPAHLAQLLKQEPVNRALIFTRTKHGADKVVKSLAKSGIRSNAIHGNKSQNHRERVLAAFRTGEIRTLVATDIAARGIDVDGISHVVNFDLPNVPETYVHRIGRTARAGTEGAAISLVAGAEEMAYLRDIEKLIRVVIPREDRRTSGQREAAPAPQQHRGGNNAPHGHAARAGDVSSGKGSRRRRGKGTPQTNRRPESSRQETPRSAQGSKPGGMQGVAFLHRKSRPERLKSNQPPQRQGEI